MSTGIEQRVSFDIIRYANCWEDADILQEALKAGPDRRVLSIASGGDNALALAACGAEVVAADLSPAQLACCELKVAAIRKLDHPEVLAFLGIRPSGERGATYLKIRGDLPDATRAFWDVRQDRIAAGIVHVGKFERYFGTFHTRVLPLVHGRRRVLELLEPMDRRGREAFYCRTWNNWRWRLLFRVFFSRFVMGRLGRDPEFFRYVTGSVSDRIMARARHALTALSTHDNPYLQYILRGNFDRALPPYLRPERFEALRAGTARVRFVQGTIESAAGTFREGGFDGFNLSDIFEYLDVDTCERIYGALLDTARPGARLAYWNMLVPRRCPERLAGRVRSLAALADDLFLKDKAFFYSAFVVEEVL